MIMPSTKVRVVGSGYTSFNYNAHPIAFLEGIEDSGQRAFSDAGQGYAFIHPLNDAAGKTSRHPTEIATSRVVQGGTLMLTIRELWNHAVWEQLFGLAGTNNIIDVFDVLARNSQYVTCTQIIKPPDGSRRRGKIYHNCFRGDTEYLTETGLKTLVETVGTAQMVLGKTGVWTPAEIRSFGDQPLMRVVLSRQGREREIYATADHRWFVADRWGSGRNKRRDVEKTTATLLVGDHLPNRFARRDMRVQPSSVGIQAGVVFGDGGREGRGSVVSLWGQKDAALLKHFPNSPTTDCRSEGGVSGIKVHGLPGYFKAAPPMDESASYLLGWLAGYFAADGTVDSNGAARLAARHRDSLIVAQAVCQRLGIPTYDIRSSVSGGFNGPQDAFDMAIDPSTLGEEFFLIETHRERIGRRLSRPEKAMADWSVVSVEPTPLVEEVFCAVVPQGNEFTLAGNVRTSNCVVVDIQDGDTIQIGSLAVTKGITVAYTHSSKV